MNIEKILFPTDFSEGASHALPYAVDLARHYNANLYILHVIYDIARATDSHIPHISADELYKGIAEWAQEQIGKCCTEDVRGLKDVKRIILKGIPYEEIIRFAETEKIDIIVIGTYGRVGLERFLFGSTAERVVRRGPCPVLTVRVPKHRKK